MMAQTTLESFLFSDPLTHPVHMVPVLIIEDINVAWNDRDWFLHKQDLVYLDTALAKILLERGIAKDTGDVLK
jgi:hypothetical protein